MVEKIEYLDIDPIREITSAKNEMINNIIKEINSAKEYTIRHSLDAASISIHEIIKNRRFKLLVRLEDFEGNEYYYYNDDSANGLFVCGFSKFSFNDSMKIITEEPEFLKIK